MFLYYMYSALFSLVINMQCIVEGVKNVISCIPFPCILLCVFGVPVNSVQLVELGSGRRHYSWRCWSQELNLPQVQALPQAQAFSKSSPPPDLTGGEQDVPVNPENG